MSFFLSNARWPRPVTHVDPSISTLEPGIWVSRECACVALHSDNLPNDPAASSAARVYTCVSSRPPSTHCCNCCSSLNHTYRDGVLCSFRCWLVDLVPDAGGPNRSVYLHRPRQCSLVPFVGDGLHPTRLLSASCWSFSPPPAGAYLEVNVSNRVHVLSCLLAVI